MVSLRFKPLLTFSWSPYDMVSCVRQIIILFISSIICLTISTISIISVSQSLPSHLNICLTIYHLLPIPLWGGGWWMGGGMWAIVGWERSIYHIWDGNLSFSYSPWGDGWWWLWWWWDGWWLDDGKWDGTDPCLFNPIGPIDKNEMVSWDGKFHLITSCVFSLTYGGMEVEVRGSWPSLKLVSWKNEKSKWEMIEDDKMRDDWRSLNNFQIFLLKNLPFSYEETPFHLLMKNLVYQGRRVRVVYSFDQMVLILQSRRLPQSSLQKNQFSLFSNFKFHFSYLMHFVPKSHDLRNG